MLQGLEQLCSGDSLRELGLFILKERRLRGDIRAAPVPEGATRNLERGF